MGFVKGNNCPHYNSEKDREPSVHKFLNDKIIDSCYASDDGSALHFSNGELKSAVSFYEKANSYDIFIKDNKVNQKTIKAIEIYWTLFIVPLSPVTSHFTVLNKR